MPARSANNWEYPSEAPELSALGVDTTENGNNGDGSKFAAVALAMLPMTDAGTPADFLHSRLAPPKEQKIPYWAQVGGLVAILVIALSIYAYTYLDGKQADWHKVQSEVDSHQTDIKNKNDFLSQVTFAERCWHGGDPRYLACMKDVIDSMPGLVNNSDTYATFLEVKEAPRPTNSATAGTSKADESRSLTGHCGCPHHDPCQHHHVLAALRTNKAFTDVKIGATIFTPRTRETSFSISFTYTPGKN